MSNSCVTVKRKPPPKQSVFPTRHDLTLIARIEDHFGHPNRMDELLFEWHHGRAAPLADIAAAWSETLSYRVTSDWLAYIASCYGVAVLPYEQQFGLVKPIGVTKSLDGEPFRGIGKGIVAQRIINLWQHDHDWSRVLSRLHVQDNRVTLLWLRAFIQEQGPSFANLISTDDISCLFTRDIQIVAEADQASLFGKPKRGRPKGHKREAKLRVERTPKPESSGQRGSSKFRDEDASLDVYLRQINKTPLITIEREVRLAIRIKQGDKKALDELVSANLRFVVHVAKQYQGLGLSLGDLINEGNIGLIKAAKRFDETRGFKFISYAVWWIRQAILQSLAENSRIVRLPLNRVGTLHKINKAKDRLTQQYGRDPSPDEIAIELALTEDEVDATMSISSTHLSLDRPLTDEYGADTLGDKLEDTTFERPDEMHLTQSLIVEVEKALDTLTAREAEVLTLYFGLNHQQALKLEEIGARFSLTRERVRQIKEKALRRMRHASRSRALRAYLNMFDNGGNNN